MSVIFDSTTKLKDHVQACLEEEFARRATCGAQENFNARREAQAAGYEGWEDYRSQAAAIRDDVLNHLDYYLQQFVDKTTDNGNIVHFADTAEEAGQILLDICRAKNAQTVVKTKSMVSEEIDCNALLLRAGLEVTETALGEYMLQLDNWSHPSHLLMPGMHMDIKTIYNLFVEKGYKGAMDAHEMTLFARDTLRQKFLTADVGITSCNFAIAGTGSIGILTNEGNGRMVSTLPDTQIVLMGMERILPNMQAFDAMMQVFVRTAIGTAISSYISFLNKPRGDNEQDGPKEVHVIIIDNGRSQILGSRYKSMLRCVRCGACQNICPVFRHITGHGYGTCYQGPMGIVYSPLLHGFDDYTKDLPYACTLCGACTEVCPVKIPLHELILAERQALTEETDLFGKRERRYAKAVGAVMAHHDVVEPALMVAKPLMRGLARLTMEDDHLGDNIKLPLIHPWTDSRNFPLLRSGEFRRWFDDNHREGR